MMPQSAGPLFEATYNSSLHLSLIFYLHVLTACLCGTSFFHPLNLLPPLVDLKPATWHYRKGPQEIPLKQEGKGAGHDILKE